MNELHDTLINIQIFAFVGLLIWLYSRPSHLEKTSRDEGAEVLRDRED